MTSPDLSTIAQLLYTDTDALDFARIVSELDTVLRRMRGKEVDIQWDCDDLVTFDLPETRILLSWSEADKRGIGACLTVSVGPAPRAAAARGGTNHDVLCSRLVERIQGRFAAESVLWHQEAGPADADVVDRLVDRLPHIGEANLPSIDSILDMLSRADLDMAALQARPPHPRSIKSDELSLMAMAPGAESLRSDGKNEGEDGVTLRVMDAGKADLADDGQGAANDVPDLPRQRNAELTRVRAALYAEPETVVAGMAPADGEQVVYSTQMRLAAHCMNATLILVWAPLGAAVMTYSVLRGENMRLSARMMAVAGTIFALANSPVGQTVAAVAKGIS